MDIYARGGLGAQILEFFLGLAYAVNNNKDYNLIFSSKPPPKNSKTLHVQDKPTILDLFSFNKDIEIRNNTYKKLCYWHTGYIDNFFRCRYQLLGKIIYPKYSLKVGQGYTAIHIRGAEKIQGDPLEVYKPLIYEALSYGLPIKVVTDDIQLSSYITNHFNIRYTPKRTLEIEDWLTVLYAENVLAIYSTFSYSTLLIDPLKNFVVLNYRQGSLHYKYAANEYRAITQFMKFCPNLRLTNSTRTQPRTNYIHPRPNVLPATNGDIVKIISSNGCISDKEEIAIKATLDDLQQNQCDQEVLFELNNLIMKPYLPQWAPMILLKKQQKLLNLIRKTYLTRKKDFALDDNIPVHYFFRGFHLLRSYVAHLNHISTTKKTRQTLQLKSTLNNSIFSAAKELDSKGLLIIPNFLQSQQADDIRATLSSLSHFGSLSKTKTSLLNSEILSNSILKIFLSNDIAKLLSYLSGYPLSLVLRQLIQNTFLQKVIIHPDRHDIQSVLHSDTFFPAFKFWYFPDKVNEDEGPFNYVRMSHIPSCQRMEYESNQSKDSALHRNKSISIDHMEGSFRISDNEVMAFGLSRENIKVLPNTLVIANVFGYHARGYSKKMTSRIAIHGSLRSDFISFNYENPNTNTN